jgi:hypothetical protein
MSGIKEFQDGYVSVNDPCCGHVMYDNWQKQWACVQSYAKWPKKEHLGDQQK